MRDSWRLATVVIAVALAAGCTSTPKAVDMPSHPPPDPAAPTPAPTPTPSPTPPLTPPPTPPPGDVAPLVLGPAGIGALHLGMTRDQAESTKLITPFQHADETNCGWVATLAGAPPTDTSAGTVLASETFGVAAIFAYGAIGTPEHITLGSTGTDVNKAYPGADLKGSVSHGNVYAAAPGNADAQYRFELQNGTVTEIALQLTQQDCNE